MAYAEPTLPPPGANTAYLPDSTPRSGGLILYAKTIARWTPNAVALFFGGKETDTLTTRRRQAACLTALLGGECSVSRLKGKGGGHRHVVTACAHTRWCYSVHYAFNNRTACGFPRNHSLLYELYRYKSRAVELAQFVEGNFSDVGRVADALAALELDSTADVLAAYYADAVSLGLTGPDEIAHAYTWTT